MAFTVRQQLFIDEYLKCWNASEAARRAGYTGDANTVGPRLLANVGIKEEVERRKAQLIMSPEEVAARLTEQGRAEYANYFTPDGFDLERCIADGKGHLIKKIKPTREGMEIEFHDPQAALVHVGRIHKMFTERTELVANTATVMTYIPDNGRGDGPRA